MPRRTAHSSRLPRFSLSRAVGMALVLALPAIALPVVQTGSASAAPLTAAAPASTSPATAQAGTSTPDDDPAAVAPAGSATTTATAPEADGVKVGAGSYAPTPPSSITDSADVQATLDQHLYIDPSQSGKPVPTNQFWTDGIVSKFAGNMWTDPFVTSNSASGNKISAPSTWNSDGTSMVVPESVTVGGTVTPTPDPSDETIGDFESGIPSGWTQTGSAFSVASASGAGQSPVTGWIGQKYLTSWGAANGDGATGTITSPAFTLDKSSLAFMLAGGDHPADEAVNLVVNGQVVDSATGSNSETFAWVDWDVTKWAGQQAQVQIVDSLNAGWAHLMVDQLTLTNVPTGLAQRYSTTFRASENDALRWGDWNVTFRLPQVGTGGQYMDVSEVQGSPYEYYEYHDMTPELTAASDATFTDASGNAIAFPYSGGPFEIRQNGEVLGVHAPDGTTFTKSGTTLDASAGTAFLVLSDVPSSGLTLGQLQEYAYAIPRNTTMDYSYSPAKGQVDEQWKVDTTPLQGSNTDTVQGFLQHQYEDTTNNLTFTGATYQTPRGRMKTAIGHDDWTIDYAFSGLTPLGGTPSAAAGAGGPAGDAYSKDIMTSYLHSYAAKTTYGGDTYWGGKDLEQLAEYMTVAKQIGDSADEKTLQATLTGALTDWYTYSTGESQHFFAMYPTWKALIGFGDSYGSAQFNDNHFHYGYFAVASALLGSVDPTWAKGYGDMASLVVKEYADWDRTDPQFPHLRTFGVFEGHSNAGGVSSPNGNNQESSSEAIQSEAGVFLLGTVLGNKDMQATGAMEYVNERASVQDYYQNAHGNPASKSYDGNGAFPAAYQYGQTGILFDSGQAEATYFSADPAWIYGIQWMPTAPWFNYFGWDPDFAKSIMQQMMDARPKVVGQDMVRSANAGDIQMLTKEWYGIGTNGSPATVPEKQSDAITQLENAIRSAETNHPGYVVAKTAANPLYDAASGTLYVSLDADGDVVFPAQYWTPSTLPAALVPARQSSTDVDKQPQDWPVQSPLLPYLSTDYTADTTTIDHLYRVDLAHYRPGTDTAQAAAVFSTMGDALGNVVLGYLAQYDPATYADIHAALWKANDPAVTGQSMAGMDYYEAMSNETVGTEVTTRHTDDPLSQVYVDAHGQYSYVLDNIQDTQQTYHVYDGSTVIGTIAVPADTEITSHLDATLTKVVVTTPGSPKTIVPGSSTAFTATGYDQYGATVPLTGVSWTAGVGSIDADGEYTASTATDSTSVTATVNGVSGSFGFRVAPAPVLSSIKVTPGFDRLVVGTGAQFHATGLDQYGDPAALPTGLTWSYTGPGSVASDGTLTTTGPGAGLVVATDGVVQGSAAAASVTSLPDTALGKQASATFAQTGATTPSESGNVPADALDNDLGTRWESINGADPDPNGPDYADVDFTVDLGKETDINDVLVDWEGAYAIDYSLQVSDSATSGWRTLKTVTDKSNADPDDLPAVTTARYVRLEMTKRWNDSYGFSIKDLHVYGTPSASAITPTDVLVAPGATTTLPGSTTKLTAYAFDAAGDGGAVDTTSGGNTPVWTIDGGGSVAADGTVTAADAADVLATVTATVGAAFGEATVTTMDNSSPATDPTPAPGTDQDVAIGKPVTTSSNESNALNGDRAVDGDGQTRWSSAAQDGQWIAVDLGSVLPIDSVELDWEAAYASSYEIQVRNATTDDWETVVTDSTGTGGVEAHALTGVSARYVRMLGGQRATSYGYSLYEFRVDSTQGSPTPDYARGAVTTSSSDESTSVPASNATDGDPTTRWASGHTDGEWLDIDLGAQRALHRATLVWEGAYGKSYQIQARNSAGDSWTTIATNTDGQGGTETLPLTGTWQYIRFQGVQRATPYGYSLYSFQIR